MPSTYSTNNGFEKPGDGEQTGTWGQTVNTNTDMLDEALDGQVTVTLASTGTSGAPNSLPITDGASSNGRNRMVIFDDGGDLGGTAYVQLTPNDAEKLIYVRNSLSGSRSILLFQGTYNAANDFELLAGCDAVLRFDGAGAGATVTAVFENLYLAALTVSGNVGIGTATPSRKLDVVESTAGATIKAKNTDSDCTISAVAASNADKSTWYCGNGSDALYGAMRYQHDATTPYFEWEVNGTSAMSLGEDGTNGNLLVGVGGGSGGRIIAANCGQAAVTAFRAYCANGSFATEVATLDVFRTASTAFSFCKMRSDVAGAADSEFHFRGDGNAFADGSFTGGGADYAEYFEWHPDILATVEAMDTRGISVVLDGVYIRPASDGDDPIGVVSVNPSVVGDGDIDRWKGKYLKDAFGDYVMEDVEIVTWIDEVVETKVEKVQATKTVQRDREVVEIINGTAVKRTITEAIETKQYDELPVVDADGNPVTERVQVGEEKGVPIYETRPLIHREPRMIETEVVARRYKEVRNHVVGELPADVVVPDDATYDNQQRRKLNPDFDPTLEYVPRAERAEWAVIGLVGKLRVVKGQPVGSGWIKMRDISAEVEEWLIR